MTPRSSRDGRRLAAGSHAHGGMNVNQLVDHAVSSCQGGGGRGCEVGRLCTISVAHKSENRCSCLPLPCV